MSDDLVNVVVADGKYTFGQRKDGSCYALRYGEPWREDIFDGLTLAMAHRIEELEADRRKTYEALLKVTRIHDEVEIKLTKAVEALEMADQAIMENTTDQDLLMWGEQTVSHIRTTLAELKGQGDE